MKQTITHNLPTKEVRIRFTCSNCDLDVWAGEFEKNPHGTIECPHCHKTFSWYAGVIELVEVNGAN